MDLTANAGRVGPVWLSDLGAEWERPGSVGHCFKELGDGGQAGHFARRSLDMVDGYTRGRTFNILLLASAQLQQRDLEAACATGNQALDLAAGLHSARTIRYMRDLRRRMSAFSGQPGVPEFQARAHDLLPASDLRQVRNGHAA